MDNEWVFDRDSFSLVNYPYEIHLEKNTEKKLHKYVLTFKSPIFENFTEDFPQLYQAERKARSHNSSLKRELKKYIGENE